MKPLSYKPLFFLVITILIAAAVSMAMSQSPPVVTDWRTDYQAMSQNQFENKYGHVFLMAIQTGCDSKLNCQWENNYGHGTVQSVSFFYDADGCSANPKYFPDEMS
ncbi:hypothetical protein, partial [Candidatus Parabeggiatoa sp. HSG14]|uniref:hypothetical protein n=1 Tax=Candidatus Parabeggiatoa sp. HSG14 TaxID=3055593 RepID=UPI0025A8AC49|nr:hypothetical protein [Thiotrichales bacterium HSG14]